ncbi:MAG: hypothetical protein K2W95_35815 [Candidatus Obscuribacterales bacterium]|nr:hypothetical protein [Candidatus Obscuribacterales bacterium]
MKETRKDIKRERNSEESLVGRAHHAFRAYVKAYTLKTGQKHSYKIADDKRSASILDEAGGVVLTRSIDQFAAEGGRVRLAFAGLKDLKEKVDGLFAAAGETADVRYNLDILEKSATLSVDGTPVDNSALVSILGGAYKTPTGANPVGEAIANLSDADLLSIEGWEKIGRPVSALLYAELSSAEEYRLEAAAAELRERAYRLGLIRRPREEQADR